MQYPELIPELFLRLVRTTDEVILKSPMVIAAEGDPLRISDIIARQTKGSIVGSADHRPIAGFLIGGLARLGIHVFSKC